MNPLFINYTASLQIYQKPLGRFTAIFLTSKIEMSIVVPCRLRFVVLLALLRSQFEAEPSRKVVVFFSTCGEVDFHYALISEFHWVTHFQYVDEEKGSFIKSKTFRLHGNMA